MAGAGVETELKFQLPPARRAAVERALATRTAERVRLRAQYFDTPDARLAGARLALRLRQEGERWVQTLKGQGDGLLQRLEDEVPLERTGAGVPALDLGLHEGTAAGAALARALAGSAPPQMLYGTDIQRLKRVLHSGGARIEVALDVGELQAGAARAPVCELEFELLSGPVHALLALAGRWAGRYGLVLDVTTKAERGQRLAAGRAEPPVVRATDPRLPAALPLAAARPAMVRAALAHALPNAAAITNGVHGADHVHQLRVALRRLRTVLRAFGPPDAARDEALAKLFAALGGTRDADVLALTLAPAWAAAEAAGLPVPVPLAPAAADDAAAALRAPAAARLWLQLIGLAQAAGAQASDRRAASAATGDAGATEAAAADAQPWSGAAAHCVARWRRQLRRGLRNWGTLDDPARHRLRKRLKRLRYLLDFSAGLWPAKAAARELAALRPLQEALGHWNDIVVARAHVAALMAQPKGTPTAAPEVAPSGPAPALPFAAGWLAREAVAADAACADAAARWRRLPPLGGPKPLRRRKKPPSHPG